MKGTLFLAAALSLGIAGAAAAQTAPTGGPTAKGNAPVKQVHTVNDGAAKPGHNSFTEGQARQHILNSGYTAVTGLNKGSDGVWRGRASKGGGAPVDVAMDFKGNVTQGAGGLSGGGMHNGANGGVRHGGGVTGHTAAPVRSDGASMSSAAGPGMAQSGGMRHGGDSHHVASSGHHGRHWRHHVRHHHRRHHHHGAVGMSGVDRNDNGISDKEDRARRH